MRMKAPALAPWPCSTSGLSWRSGAGSAANQDIVRRGFAADGKRCTPSLSRGAISAKRLVGALAAGQAVGDDADVMAAVGLAVGEVEDVAENAADRSAHGVQDTKRPVGSGRA